MSNKGDDDRWKPLRGPYELVGEPKAQEGPEDKPIYWSFRWDEDAWQNDLIHIVRQHQTGDDVKRIKIKDANMFRTILHDALRTAIEEELGLKRWKFCLRPQRSKFDEDAYSVVVESFKIITLHDDALMAHDDWNGYIDHQPEEKLVQGPDPEKSNVYVHVDLEDIIPEKRDAIKERLVEIVGEKWRGVESVEFSQDEHAAKFKIRRAKKKSTA